MARCVARPDRAVRTEKKRIDAPDLRSAPIDQLHEVRGVSVEVRSATVFDGESARRIRMSEITSIRT